MALVSPGLEVQVIDESTYLASAVATIPLVVIATEENKVINGQIAQGTTKENAGKLAVITSQRELVNLYGFPEFKRSAIGTALHGDELNEYGLMAAYSALGVGNRAYVIRADVDLAKLEGTPNRPVGQPSDGANWLDTSDSEYGIFQWNSVTKKFTKFAPRLVSDPLQLVDDGGIVKPKSSVGSIGEYAVVISEEDSTIRGFYKGTQNDWSLIGTDEWKRSIPAVVGSQASPELTIGYSIVINGVSITADATDLPSFVQSINSANISGVSAGVINGNIAIYVDSNAASDGYVLDGKLSLQNGVGNILFELGLEVTSIYYSPQVHVDRYTNLPSWNFMNGIPSGSVWIKTSAVGDGVDVAIKKYAEDISGWNPVTNTVYLDIVDPLNEPTIPPQAVFTVANKSTFPLYELKLFQRSKEMGVSATFVPSADFTIGDQFGIVVSDSDGNVRSYNVTVSGTSVESFVNDIQSKNIPEIEVVLTATNSIKISNVVGGFVNLFDIVGTSIQNSGLTAGMSGLWPVKDVYELYDEGDVIDITGRATGTYYGYVVNTLVGNEGDRMLDPERGIEYYWSPLDQQWLVSGIGQDFYVGANAPTIVNSGAISLWLNQDQGRLYAYSNQKWVLIWSDGSGSSGIYISNVEPLVYAYGNSAPTTRPMTGDLWYYNDRAEVDILINTGIAWRGYRNVQQDIRGYNLSLTDPTGVIVSSSEPIEQSTGNDLVPGDLWLDSSDVKNYPRIYRRTSVGDWELIDKTDQVSENGLVFADVRWATSGSVDPSRDPLPSISSLAVSDYVDLDAPDPRLYPTGILVFNLRRSGYSVKKYVRNYFNSISFPNEELPLQKDSWTTVSGLQNDGSMFAGPQAQRNMVVSAMKSALDTNETIREDQWQFSLIAAPGYPELIVNMVALNKDRSESAFVIGDTPMDLPPNMVDITNWMNANLTIPDAYLGVFYPSGLSNDLSGNEIAVPPSHMILRTVMRSDNVSFPWFAPAGARRGLIDNATTIGTIDPNTGEFGRFSVNRGLRDALYEAKINPLTILPGTGLLNYGQKTRYGLTSALDRINVARLINYIRTALQPLANNFLFEPNDKIVRDQIKQSVEGLMNDLVAKRALYDYLVVVDESNNTPDRIARNELYVDIAIAPVRTVEFIYIPLRIRNPGDI
jgi:hypothetical protein